MAVAFLLISILGIIVFFKAGDQPVGGLFIGLACVYVAEFFASLGGDVPRVSRPPSGRSASFTSAPAYG